MMQKSVDEAALRKLASAVLVLGACSAAVTGPLFWADRQFYWLGESVESGTQHGIGLAFVLLGISMAYAAVRIAGHGPGLNGQQT